MRTFKKIAALFMSAILLLGCSGCAGGIDETVSLIKKAEKTKQGIQEMEQENRQAKSVGTIANSNITYVVYVEDFNANYNAENQTLDFSWKVNNSSDVVKMDIQVYADTNVSGINGSLAAEVKEAECEGTLEIALAETITALSSADYYFYICAMAYDSENVMYVDYCYDLDLVPIPAISVINQSLEAEGLSEFETAPSDNENTPVNEQAFQITNIAATRNKTELLVRWDLLEGFDKYRIAAFESDTDTVIAETVVSGNVAKLSVPDGTGSCEVGVAAFSDKDDAVYAYYKITINTEG